MTDKEKIAHDISLTYVLYSNVSENPSLTPLDFYQEYVDAYDTFKIIVENN